MGYTDRDRQRWVTEDPATKRADRADFARDRARLIHSASLRRLSAMGLHELKNGRLRMLNTRALARIAEYYDRPPRLLPML